MLERNIYFANKLDKYQFDNYVPINGNVIDKQQFYVKRG